MNPKWMPDIKAVFFLVITASLFRALYYYSYTHYVPNALLPQNDAQMYWQWGLDLYRNGWMHPHNEAYYQAPLYSMFIALIHHAGYHSIQTVIAIQLAIGVCSTLLCYATARHTLNPQWAWMAAVCFSFCPYIFFFETKLTATTLGLFLWLCFMLAMVRWIQKPSWLFLVVSAFLFGLSVICRPNLLFTFPFLFISFLNRDWKDWNGLQHILSWQKMKYSVIFTCVVIAMVYCVTARNYLASGEWVLLTGNSGVTLYMGNNPDAIGGLSVIPGLSNNIDDQVYGSIELASQLKGEPLTLNESSKFWMAKTVAYITQNPIHWVALLCKKLLWSVNYHPPAVNYSYLFESEWLWVEKLLSIITAGILSIGIIALFHTNKFHTRIDLFYLMVILGYLSLTLVYYASGRFLTTVIPVLAIMCAHYLQYLYNHYQSKSKSKVILMIWFAAFFVMNPLLMKYQEQEIATGWYNLGVTAETNPNAPFSAKDCYYKALEHDSTHPSSMLNLGVVLANEGNLSGANEWFEKVLKREPHNQTALQNLMINYQRMGMNDQIPLLKQKYPMNTERTN